MDRLEANRNYDCFCGTGIAADFVCSYLLEKLNLGKPSTADFKVAIVSDRQVSGYYYNTFENQFILRNIKPKLIVCEACEGGKSLDTVSYLISEFNDAGLGKEDWVIALGGGGITDVAGFACSVYTGQSKLILVPTTPSAMAESTTATECFLNSGKNKNTAVAKISPDSVFVDPTFLATVPAKYKSNGYASVIRLAVLGYPELLKDMANPSNLREYLSSVYAARSAIEIKNPWYLTLGSEIAGAIEGYFRFMNYSDGEALALSLLSTVPDNAAAALRQVYGKLGLPVKLEGVSGAMIKKAALSALELKGRGPYEIVDYDAQGPDGKGNWVIRRVSLEEAAGIFDRRISVITGDAEQ